MRGDRPRLLVEAVSWERVERAGMAKARVFPEPVSAIPTTSRWPPRELEVRRTGCDDNDCEYYDEWCAKINV